MVVEVLSLNICSVRFRISDNPDDTAERDLKLRFVKFDIILASVVLPVPGGPQNIIDGMDLFSIKFRKIFPSPKICSCPINSSKDSGRNLEDKGEPDSNSFLLLCSNSVIC